MNLKFSDITPDFLQDFENWMVNRGKSITTVGIYLRQLRAIINIAKEKGIIRPQDYPFGRRKYIIPGGNNMKKALNISQIKQIFEYQASTDTGMDKARDFWILSYLCNGINMMDLGSITVAGSDRLCYYVYPCKNKKNQQSQSRDDHCPPERIHKQDHQQMGRKIISNNRLCVWHYCPE